MTDRAARPLISVLTPTFNGAEFVAETIESVLAQTYAAVEHVIVDDASTDGTPAILDDYARRYPDHVRVVHAPARAGPCRRRNDAYAHARGDLLAWLDHDDLWLPAKLERQVAALAANPRAVLAFTQYERFDHETGETVERSRLQNGSRLFERLFEGGCFVASSTVVFRRDAMQRRRLRFRDSHFSFGDDYFLWLALLLDGEGILVDEPLVRLRRHAGNESARLARENYCLWTIDLLEEFLAAFPDAAARLGRARRRGFAYQYASAAILERRSGRATRAARLALRAARLDPRGAASYATAVSRGYAVTAVRRAQRASGAIRRRRRARRRGRSSLPT